MKESLVQTIKMAMLISSLAAVLAFFNYLYHEGWCVDVEAAPVSDVGKVSGVVNSKELEDLIQQGGNLLILDAQADWFYEQEHIPGALNLPNEELHKHYPLLKEKIGKAKHVVVYCADKNCANSKILALALRKLGHVNISVYSGGLKEWKASGKETKAKQ